MIHLGKRNKIPKTAGRDVENHICFAVFLWRSLKRQKGSCRIFYTVEIERLRCSVSVQFDFLKLIDSIEGVRRE